MCNNKIIYNKENETMLNLSLIAKSDVKYAEVKLNLAMMELENSIKRIQRATKLVKELNPSLKK